MPSRDALSAYAGPIPRRVVPIWSLPRRRSPAPSIAMCQGMIRWALPEIRSGSEDDAALLELVELLQQDAGVDDAAGPEDTHLARRGCRRADAGT